MQDENPLRLAYLVSRFPAVNHTYLLREVRALRRLGVAIEVASISPPDRPGEELAEEEREEAARTFYVKRAGALRIAGAHLAAALRHPAGYARGLAYPLIAGRGDVRRTLAWFFYFVEAVVVGRWMERRGLGHVHVHFSSSVGLIVGRVFPVTWSMAVHGYGELHEDPVGYRLADKVAAARFVCAVSRYGRSQLMRLCRHRDWDKLAVTPLGIDPEAFPPRPFRPAPAPFELVYVGRLAREKALHVLVAALGRLARQGRDVRLRLVGDGPDRAGLEEHAAGLGLAARVRFEGWLGQERLRRVYEQADAFVLPSLSEGIPVVLMEAMSMEIPCVATHITGIPELIRNGVDGLLVTPSDDQELAAAVAALMDDAELRRRLGRAGRERVLRDYVLERNVARLAEVFRERLGARAAAEAMLRAGARS